MQEIITRCISKITEW